MRVRNNGRIVFPKGVELDRDIQPGETTLVKPGFEQSERIVNAIQSGSLVAITVSNIRTEGGTVAVEPGNPSPLSEFGESLPLPKRVREEQEKHKRWAEEQEEVVIRPSEDPITDASTSQLVNEEHLTDLVNDPKIVKLGDPESGELATEASIDQFAEFQRRNGGARVKYVQKMTDLSALRAALNEVKGGKTRTAIETRIAEIGNKPEQLD